MRCRWLVLAAALTHAGCHGSDDDTGDAEGCSASPGCLLGEDLAAGLLSVRVVTAQDVWITGASPDPADGTGPVVLHWDGAEWTRLDTSAWAGAELWWGWVDSEQAVFVGSEGLVLEHDRGSESLMAVQGIESDTTLYGVWGASKDDLWAVGETAGGDGPPALWRRQAGAWGAWATPELGQPVDGATWFKVHGRAADDLWIVGTQGTALHWDGAVFTATDTATEVDTSNAPLLTVDAGGDRPVAVGGTGNGLVLEYDGGAWHDLSPAFQPGFNGVCSGAGTAWVVGQHGARAHREDEWVSDTDDGVTPLTLQDWHGCAVAPDGALWTVGGRVGSRPLIQGVVGYQGDEEIAGVAAAL